MRNAWVRSSDHYFLSAARRLGIGCRVAAKQRLQSARDDSNIATLGDQPAPVLADHPTESFILQNAADGVSKRRRVLGRH